MIPAFNAESTLTSLLQGVSQFIPLTQIIVVDDGSGDGTSSIARAMGVQPLRHAKNLGKGAALKSGLREAFKNDEVKACITMDADGQHEPHFIPRFMAIMQAERGDLVIGARRLSLREMPILRVMSNRLTSALISLKLGQPIQDSQCGYRLISRKAFSELQLSSDGFDLESEMLMKAGRAELKIVWLRISTIYCEEKSHIRGLRDTWRFVKTYLSL